MTTMARIQNGVVVEVLTADPFPPFNPVLVWVVCDSTVQPGYLYDGTNFSAPVIAQPSAAQLWSAYQVKAQAQLDANDKVATRCLKASVTYPATWLAYDEALRAIVRASSGDPTQPLPTQPPYPTGT